MLGKVGGLSTPHLIQLLVYQSIECHSFLWIDCHSLLCTETGQLGDNIETTSRLYL